MNQLNIYKELTYIECYDGEIRTTTASLETINKLLRDEQFLNLGTELINKSNIKRVFIKELSDVDKVVYSIDDKNIRQKVQEEIKQRVRDGKRINVEIVQNLLSKYQ